MRDWITIFTFIVVLTLVPKLVPIDYHFIAGLLFWMATMKYVEWCDNA